jgi:hypothetical protein
MMEPVRASPPAPAGPTAPGSAPSSGASVATTIMMLPSPPSAPARPPPAPLEGVLAQRPTDRGAVDGEHAAVVALHQHAHRPAAQRRRQHPRRRPDPALPAERDRPGPAPTRPPPRRRPARLQRGHHVLGRDRAGADVVQRAVVRLADDGIDGAHVLHPGPGQQPLHHGVGGAPDAQRARQQDRRLQLAQLPDLRHADQLAEPVATTTAAGTRSRKGRRRAGGSP